MSARRALRAIDGLVFAPDDARRLAAVRIALFSLLAIRLATNGGYADVAGQPAALFDPVSLFHLLPSMPSSELVLVVQVLGVVLAVLAAAGLWPRLTFPGAFVAALFLNLMLNATGKIVHNDVVLTLCLLPLLLCPIAATAAWSMRAPWSSRSRPAISGSRLFGVAYGWPVRTGMLVIGFAYLFAGIQKLHYSGLEWATSDNLRNVLWASSDGRSTPNDVALFVAGHDWLYHALAAGALAVEVGFILCLPFAILRWFFVPAVIGLHLGIWLAMGLNYSSQALTVAIVFVNWAAVATWLQNRRERSTEVPEQRLTTATPPLREPGAT